MTDLPKLPRGISRDETEHGRIYYTRAQMMAYGRECYDYEPPYEQPKHSAGSGDVVDDLMGMIFKKGKHD